MQQTTVCLAICLTHEEYSFYFILLTLTFLLLKHGIFTLFVWPQAFKFLIFLYIHMWSNVEVRGTDSCTVENLRITFNSRKI